MRAWRRLAVLGAMLLVAGGAAAADPSPGSVLPAADRFEPSPGPVPYWRGFKGDAPVGVVLSTAKVTGSVGYSGKPLDILVGVDQQGILTGAVVLEQHEPIMATGSTAADIDAFVARLAGHALSAPLEVVRARPGEGEVDAVAGATISSMVIVDSVLTAARVVARDAGILARGSVDLDAFEPLDWQQLLQDGSLAHARLTGEQARRLLAPLGARLALQAESDTLVQEIWQGLASAARIGRNLLGRQLFEQLQGDLAPGDLALFVGGRGLYSFRGTSWRRTGVLERIQIAQEDRTWRIRATDHRRLDRLAIAGAPELREMSLLLVRAGSGFRPDRPWRLQLALPGEDAAGNPVTALADFPYELPARYLLPEPTPPPLWQRSWYEARVDIAVLAAALGVLTAIFFGQEWLVKTRARLRWARLSFLVFTLLWLGWYAAAQLSVVNVLTFVDALRLGFSWEGFLLAPLIFILWSGVAAGLVLWGRGPFCGWLCPFGALLELTNLVARRLGVPQLSVPWRLHELLRSIKFLIFLGIFAVSLGYAELAQKLAEVEPFKTAIVMRFWREPWFVAWALAILVSGLFVERAWCRYACPLGAALALPSRLRQFEWLRRRRQCGTECRICALRCPVGAIQPEGQIHPGECIHCLECQVNYHDDHLCPPLIERRKRAERRAAVAAGTPR